MLVLTRKIGEKVFIDNGRIQITVLRSEGNTLRLGFTAPSHMDIHREEVYLQKNYPNSAFEKGTCLKRKCI